jgi:hypothetical protein
MHIKGQRREKNIPTKQNQTRAQVWIPGEDADRKRPGCPYAPPPQGARKAHGF